ncbi:chemotaxis protein CheD [Halonatronum saccharophilum]|uniref:chemotaxis protein CheD n=1 Tax=Halonatronum saccharophilum TaxID=150060 RepID=UPI0004857911|nr:chemotaxis protein CheD [Halonatronum saccharophilum]
MVNKIRVRMADLKVGRDDGIIITSGLGSCVGLTLYDSNSKVGGMAHIMLPEFPVGKKNAKLAKYADTAIETLIKKLRDKGANTKNLEAKMAGGAQMFNFSNIDNRIRIGDRNIEATKEILKSLKIPLINSEVGKNYGRTMELHLNSGDVLIKTVKYDDIVI